MKRMCEDLVVRITDEKLLRVELSLSSRGVTIGTAHQHISTLRVEQNLGTGTTVSISHGSCPREEETCGEEDSLKKVAGLLPVTSRVGSRHDQDPICIAPMKLPQEKKREKDRLSKFKSKERKRKSFQPSNASPSALCLQQECQIR